MFLNKVRARFLSKYLLRDIGFSLLKNKRDKFTKNVIRSRCIRLFRRNIQIRRWKHYRGTFDFHDKDVNKRSTPLPLPLFNKVFLRRAKDLFKKPWRIYGKVRGYPSTKLHKKRKMFQIYGHPSILEKYFFGVKTVNERFIDWDTLSFSRKPFKVAAFNKSDPLYNYNYAHKFRKAFNKNSSGFIFIPATKKQKFRKQFDNEIYNNNRLIIQGVGRKILYKYYFSFILNLLSYNKYLTISARDKSSFFSFLFFNNTKSFAFSKPKYFYKTSMKSLNKFYREKRVIENSKNSIGFLFERFYSNIEFIKTFSFFNKIEYFLHSFNKCFVLKYNSLNKNLLRSVYVFLFKFLVPTYKCRSFIFRIIRLYIEVFYVINRYNYLSSKSYNQQYRLPDKLKKFFVFIQPCMKVNADQSVFLKKIRYSSRFNRKRKKVVSMFKKKTYFRLNKSENSEKYLRLNNLKKNKSFFKLFNRRYRYNYKSRRFVYKKLLQKKRRNTSRIDKKALSFYYNRLTRKYNPYQINCSFNPYHKFYYLQPKDYHNINKQFYNYNYGKKRHKHKFYGKRNNYNKFRINRIKYYQYGKYRDFVRKINENRYNYVTGKYKIVSVLSNVLESGFNLRYFQFRKEKARFYTKRQTRKTFTFSLREVEAVYNSSYRFRKAKKKKLRKYLNKRFFSFRYLTYSYGLNKKKIKYLVKKTRKKNLYYHIFYKFFISIFTRLNYLLKAIFRFNSIYEINQWIKHGYIIVNNVKITYPDYLVKEYEIIDLSNLFLNRDKLIHINKIYKERWFIKGFPPYLSLDFRTFYLVYDKDLLIDYAKYYCEKKKKKLPVNFHKVRNTIAF